MTVKLAPETVRTKKAAGQATLPPVKAAQEMWLASNFRLEIAGLDCSKVSAIDPFTVRQAGVANPVGEVRDVLKEPANVEFPNLAITLAESAAATWMAWFDDFVVKG